MLSWISWAAVYFVVWWTVLFAVLPFGARSQVDEGEVAPGTEPGAPVRPRLLRVFLITTAVATVVVGLVYLALNQRIFGLDDIPFLPKFERL